MTCWFLQLKPREEPPLLDVSAFTSMRAWRQANIERMRPYYAPEREVAAFLKSCGYTVVYAGFGPTIQVEASTKEELLLVLRALNQTVRHVSEDGPMELLDEGAERD